jgi:hypothetical protein
MSESFADSLNQYDRIKGFFNSNDFEFIRQIFEPLDLLIIIRIDIKILTLYDITKNLMIIELTFLGIQNKH